MNRLAIFDCDGTLVDSQAAICRIMEECFDAARLEPPSQGRTRSVVGLSLLEAMQTILPEGEPDLHDLLVGEYRRAAQRLRAQGALTDALFDGTAQLLADLERAGWLLGIATGNSDHGLAHCLERHCIAAHFVTLQTADRHPSKPHPSMIEAAIAEAGSSPEACMMIGDTRYDMAMAKSAGVRGVGVAWGYHPTEELIEAGADHIAGRPADVLDYARVLT